MNLFDGALIDSHETVDVTKRNVNSAWGSISWSLTIVRFCTWHTTFSWPQFAFLLFPEKQKIKQRVNVFHSIRVEIWSGRNQGRVGHVGFDVDPDSATQTRT